MWLIFNFIQGANEFDYKLQNPQDIYYTYYIYLFKDDKTHKFFWFSVKFFFRICIVINYNFKF